MANGSAIPDALRYIDGNLDRGLGLGDIAAAAGLSPYHFSRLFSAVMGESPVSYLRRRRLAQAALRLAEEPQTRLIDLAFDCGFESQEAFTRAFRRTLGMTPGELKRRRGVGQIDDDRNEAVEDLSPRLVTEPGLQRRDAFQVAGFAGRFDPVSSVAIPGLWDRLIPRLPLPGQTDRATYGVIWSVDVAEDRINYLAGIEVASDAALPDDMQSLDIPAQTYKVFRHALDGGGVHRQIVSAMREIWSRRLPESGLEPTGAPDFESYPPGYSPGRPGTIAYWIPVSDR